MSSFWNVVCDTHDARGPAFGRRPSGMTWVDPQSPGERAGMAMAAFLIDHEWCELRLVHE